MDPISRHIANDTPPERERLSDDEAQAIRFACAEQLDVGIRRLVASCPPQAPKRRARLAATLYLGLLGQAFGFLHLFDRTKKPQHLQLAGDYLDAAREAIERSSFPPASEWLSFHATASCSAVAAVIQQRLGNLAASQRHLEDYLDLAEAAADPAYPTEDLLWGRGGYLFGVAFLRAQLGEDSVADDRIAPALDAMISVGRRHRSEHASDLIPGKHGLTPLLYMNFNRELMGFFTRAVIGSRSLPARWIAGLGAKLVSAYEERSLSLSHRYDLSLVHGFPGNLYLLMHFPELLHAQPTWERDVRQSLDCLTDYLDADHGMLELLPSPRSDESQKRRRTGRFTERVHWCGGTPGMMFVFGRAFTVFGDDTYRDAAQRAGDHVWSNGIVRKGNGICHGVAGNGYAFLSLYRATSDPRALHRALHFARRSLEPSVTQQQQTPDRPWSLYEGLMGTLCFYADCLEPAGARFPGFEV